MTVVIVTKRLDEKFYHNDNGIKNIPGGTSVQDTVTKNQRMNFYLQAQDVNMGTAKTPHYDCLMNEMNLGIDLLRKITYNLCMLYYNWNGPVKVPSVC